MRIRSGLAAAAIAGLLALPSLAQEWRGGRARIDGVVKNEKGEPIAGAKVSLRWGKSGHGGPDLTTDKSGRWSTAGLVGGPWDVDFEAAGYAPKKIQIQLSEGGRNETVSIEMEPQKVQAPAAGTSLVDLTDPDDIVDAVTDYLGVKDDLSGAERSALVTYLGGPLDLNDYVARRRKLYGLIGLVLQSPAYQVH